MRKKNFAGWICMSILVLNLSNFWSNCPVYSNSFTNCDWSDSIIMSPRYMGPNALPVPDIRAGKINDRWEVTTRIGYRFLKYDNTVDLFAKINIPVVKKIVSLEFYSTIVEYFYMDTILREERNTLMLEGEGFAYGDLNFATLIQLIKDHKKLPDISLRLNCRTASGTNLRAARYTDKPGYFFDLSLGDRLEINNGPNRYIDFYGMLGFYVWQTNLNDHRQNDAFLYGIGAHINFNYWEISNSFGGYIGYIGNGDKPMVYRAHLKYKKNIVQYKIGWQSGFKDYLYDAIMLSIIFNFDRKR
jgi:hypothetical protein